MVKYDSSARYSVRPRVPRFSCSGIDLGPVHQPVSIFKGIWVVPDPIVAAVGQTVGQTGAGLTL